MRQSLIIALISVLADCSMAGDGSERTVGSDFLSGIKGVGHALTSPLRWRSDDFITAGALAAVAAGSFLLDDEMRTVMLRNQSATGDKLEPIGFSYGAPQYAGPAALGVYLSGLIASDDWLRDTGMLLTETIVTIGIIQFPLKVVMGRARPETGEGNTSFKLFKGVAQERSSFFSGHSAIAFGFSTILARQIDHPAATVGLYALAGVTPLSRMYKDRHWFSDCVIGSALGVFIANSLLDFHKGESDETGFHVVPTENGLAFVIQL